MFSRAMILAVLAASGVVGPAGAQKSGSIDAALRVLETGSERQCKRAAEFLSQLGSRAKPAVPILSKRLAAEKQSTRYWAAVALGAIGRHAAEAMPALTRALKDASREVRLRAVFALGRTGPAAAGSITAMFGAVAHDDIEGQRVLIDALGKIGVAALDVLAGALHRPEEDLQDRAIRALKRIGQSAVPTLAAALLRHGPAVRRGIVRALHDLGADVYAISNTLVLGLRDKSQTVREKAIKLLGQIAEDVTGLAGALLEVVTDKDEAPKVRIDAIRAAAACEDCRQDTVKCLVRLSDDPKVEPTVRAAAFAALHRIDPRQRPMKAWREIACRKGEADVVRVKAFLVLASFGASAREHVPGITKHRRDRSSRVRAAVAEALGKIADPEDEHTVRILLKLTKDSKASVRERALLALLDLMKCTPAVKRESARRSRDKDAWVRVAAIRILVYCSNKPHELRRIVKRALKDTEPCVRRWGAYLAGTSKVLEAVLPDLLKAINDCNPWVRRLAMDAAVQSTRNRKAVAKALRVALDHDGTRRRAATLLLWLGDKTSAEHARQTLLDAVRSNRWEVRREAVESLVVLKDDDEAVRAVVRALGDDHVEVRRAAVSTIGSLDLGKDEHRDPLLAALDDPRASVRAAVAEALGKMKSAGESTTKALVTALGDRAERVRLSVLGALKELGGAAQYVRDRLKEVADSDASPRVRDEARAVLKALSGSGGRPGEP